MPELADIIKRQMKEKGVNATEVAAGIGVSQRMIEFYISGEKNPAFKNLVKLSNFLGFDLSELSEPIVPRETNYTEKRRNQKNTNQPLLVPLIPVEAQAGYSKNYSNTDFLNKLEWYPILPGVDPHGAIWRFFQVDGESMVDFLKDGYYVLASQVPREDWAEMKDFIVYVIVTEDFVTIKYAAKRKNGKELVLIPKNKKYEQKAINIEDVKEIWKYRRHIGWDASAGEKLEIKI